MSGLSVDVEVEGTVGVADDGDIKQSDPIVLLNLFGPLYDGMDGVEVVVEWLDVVVANGGDSVVGFSIPEQNDITGIGVVVASRVVLQILKKKITTNQTN